MGAVELISEGMTMKKTKALHPYLFAIFPALFLFDETIQSDLAVQRAKFT
jgi:hypothetical protein